MEEAAANFDAKVFLSTLPERPGIYRMINACGEVLYVGKARSLKKRVSSYFQKNLPSPRIARMVAQIASIEVTITLSEADALLLENNLIKQLNPRYNIIFRDDKSYPYIVLSRQPYPRLFFYRGILRRDAENFGPFPSASAVRESIALLQKTFRLRTCDEKVFRNRSRPCLLYQIKRCTAPCVNQISETDYAEDVKMASLFLQGRYGEVIDQLVEAMHKASAELAFEQAARLRDEIQALRQVQTRQTMEDVRSKDVDIIVAVEQAGITCINLAMVRSGLHLGDRAQFPTNATQATPAEIIAAFITQHYYEQALPQRVLVNCLPDKDSEILLQGNESIALSLPRSGIHKRWVVMAEQNARLSIEARLKRETLAGARAAALKDCLQLNEIPQRIECFDISHSSGESPVASCVVWNDGAMKPTEYRRFNIRDITAGDDYAAIKQAVLRRYTRLANGEVPRPDLVLIDGGKGQLASALTALDELGINDLNLIGVAKGAARKVGEETLILPGNDHLETNQSALHLSPDHPALHLIQEIRDEAHRFAVFGHRKQRSKTRQSSRLESIDGIGPAKRKALIARFGGIQGIIGASIDELAKTPGISYKLAEIIYQALH